VTEDRPPPSLDEIEARLREANRGVPLARNDRDPAGGGDPDGGQRGALGFAFRVGVDLVAALAVGVGGGMLLDRWLGTAPWGLIVMFFLGAGAGVVNVYRTVNGLGYAVGYVQPEAREDGKSKAPPSGDERR